MNTITRNCLLGLLSALTLSACVPLAKTDAKYLKLTSNPKSKIIHSLEDFDKKAKNGILARLDPVILKSFRDKLLFRNGGLASAETSSISQALSRRHYYRVMGFFGMAGVYVEGDRQGFECESQGSCSPRSGWICTPNCAQ